jgi:hypothetical protein
MNLTNDLSWVMVSRARESRESSVIRFGPRTATDPYFPPEEHFRQPINQKDLPETSTDEDFLRQQGEYRKSKWHQYIGKTVTFTDHFGRRNQGIVTENQSSPYAVQIRGEGGKQYAVAPQNVDWRSAK